MISLYQGYRVYFRRIFFSILLLLFFVPSFTSAHGGVRHDFSGVGGNTEEEIKGIEAEIEAKKERVKTLEQSIAQYKDDIEAKRQEAVSLSNQLSILEARAEEVELEILMTEEKLTAIELEIERIEIQIVHSEEYIDQQQKLLAALLRHIMYDQEKSYLEVAASYDNFSEFFNQIQYSKSLEKDANARVKQIRAEKAVLVENKAEQELRQDNYERNAEILQTKKEELDAQKFLKEDLLNKTQSSERTFQALLNSLKNQARETEKEIASFEVEIRRKLEAEERLERIRDEVAGGKISWPADNRRITAYFHDINYPYRHIFEHSGVDFATPQGSPLYAGKSGYVGRIRRCQLASCYAYVLIIHSDGISTLFGHMSQILVEMDQYVSRGDVIGYSGGRPGTVGAGPFTTGAHLHFEVRKDGIPVNPLDYLVSM